MDFEHEDIARLAQGFARELTAGRLGAKGEIARLYIETNPDAALDLLALLSEETSRETTDEFKLQAYLHLFGHALAQIRYHVDSGYDWAEQIADVVRQEVAVLAEDEQIDGQQL
ncbi:MAG: hypothetical protein OEM59_13360, partial [Rhodospirillales bacterium]|nr:hypothetical protein [Rhodospirillales bacterium]